MLNNQTAFKCPALAAEVLLWNTQGVCWLHDIRLQSNGKTLSTKAIIPQSSHNFQSTPGPISATPLFPSCGINPPLEAKHFRLNLHLNYNTGIMKTWDHYKYILGINQCTVALQVCRQPTKLNGCSKTQFFSNIKEFSPLLFKKKKSIHIPSFLVPTQEILIRLDYCSDLPYKKHHLHNDPWEQQFWEAELEFSFQPGC